MAPLGPRTGMTLLRLLLQVVQGLRQAVAALPADAAWRVVSSVRVACQWPWAMAASTAAAAAASKPCCNHSGGCRTALRQRRQQQADMSLQPRQQQQQQQQQEGRGLLAPRKRLRLCQACSSSGCLWGQDLQGRTWTLGRVNAFNNSSSSNTQRGLSSGAVVGAMAAQAWAAARPPQVEQQSSEVLVVVVVSVRR